CRHDLERMKNALPAHDTGVQDGIRIGKKTFAYLPRLPGFGRYVERHVNDYRRTDDVTARDWAPETAVVGISPIVTHHEIMIRGNFVRGVQFVRLGRATGVFLDEPYPIDPNGAIVNVDGVAREPDDALDVIRRIRRKGRFKDDHLLTLRIAP